MAEIGYYCQPMKGDAHDWGAPCAKLRLCFPAVRKESPLLGKLVCKKYYYDLLKMVRSTRHVAPDIRDCLLESNDPAVVEDLRQRSRAQNAQHSEGPSHQEWPKLHS
eukprot:5461742-Pyramimonas_sp.AAC.1